MALKIEIYPYREKIAPWHIQYGRHLIILVGNIQSVHMKCVKTKPLYFEEY